MIAAAIAEGFAACNSDADRVKLYNEIQSAVRAAMASVTTDPAIAPTLIKAGSIRGNDYNPNKVAPTEMALLEESIKADGVTMCVVVMADDEGYQVIDGFHRTTVITKRLHRQWVPCVVLDRSEADRMASTVRHNRARGKHQVDLMGSLIRSMMDLGWDDGRIAASMGMSEDELLRLKQTVGAAKMLSPTNYNRAWRWRDEPDAPNNADKQPG